MRRYRSVGLRPPLPQRTLDYLAHGADEGRRNAELFDAACQFRDASIRIEEAEQQLMARATLDGLSEAEARTAIRSAFAHAPREPVGVVAQHTHASNGTSPRREAKAEREAVPLSPVALPEAVVDGFNALLDACYAPAEFVAIAPAREGDDGEIVPTRGVTMTRDVWKQRVAEKGGIEKCFTTTLGLFLRINPMAKGGAKNEDVTAFRHVLVEFDRAFWLRKIGKLAVDKASGDPAPHKPLLLLVVCELAELGVLGNEFLPLNGELAFRFAGYWTVVASRRSQRPDVRMPFYHLKREGFWHPLDADNRPAVDKKLATLARFDAGFRTCLEEPEFRRQARLLLITTYFRPQEQVALGSLLDLNIPPQSAVREHLPDFTTDEAVQQGREARFRLTVVPAYNYTCVLTRYRLVTVDSGSIVDAAHIHKFADSRNNAPSNGLALCKNAHWLFDQGLWSLDDDYCVIVARNRFEEMGPTSYLLRELEHTQILRKRNARCLLDRVSIRGREVS